MKRRLRILASTGVVGMQVTMLAAQPAMAQTNSMGTVVVNGTSTGSTGGSSCWPNCVGSSYSNGSKSDSGYISVPEGEAFGKPAAPPPRTPEQRKADCDRADETRKKATELWAAGVIQSCQPSIVGQVFASVKSYMATGAVAYLAQKEVRACMDKNYDEIIRKMDSNTVEYNACMAKP